MAACHLCGRETAVTVLADHPRFRVVRCATCTLVFQVTMRAAVNPATLYDNIYAAQPDAGKATSPRPRPSPRDKLVLAEVRRAHRQPGNVLDIGCSYGDLVRAFAQAGWHAFGIDVSQHAVQWAAEQSLNCARASVESYAPPVRCDAVVMTHVLEHCAEPLAVLGRIRGWLNPGGTLHIRVPNVDSAVLRRHPSLFRGELKPFEHLYYFSPATLQAVLDKAGFSSAATLSGAFGLGSVLNHLLRSRLVLRTGWQDVSYFTQPERKSAYRHLKQWYEKTLPLLDGVPWGPADREIALVAWDKEGPPPTRAAPATAGAC